MLKALFYAIVCGFCGGKDIQINTKDGRRICTCRGCDNQWFLD